MPVVRGTAVVELSHGGWCRASDRFSTTRTRSPDPLQSKPSMCWAAAKCPKPKFDTKGERRRRGGIGLLPPLLDETEVESWMRARQYFPKLILGQGHTILSGGENHYRILGDQVGHRQSTVPRVIAPMPNGLMLR